MNIDTKTIKQLIKILESSQLSELELSQKDETIRLSRQISAVTTLAAAPVAAAPQPAPAALSEKTAEATEAGTSSIPVGHQIKSPMVGNFYASPSPEEPPYVAVGKKVAIGETLCVIEAMKMMNHIESDKAGIVKAILVENASPVEYEQPLFIIE